MRSSPLVTAVNANDVSFSNVEETNKCKGKLVSPKAICAEVRLGTEVGVSMDAFLSGH